MILFTNPISIARLPAQLPLVDLGSSPIVFALEHKKLHALTINELILPNLIVKQADEGFQSTIEFHVYQTLVK